MLVPADVGGGEAEPAQLVDAIFELARGDGSAGWCLAVAATSGMLGAYVPRDAAQEIFGDERGASSAASSPRWGAPWPADDGALHRQRPLALRQRLPALRLADGRLPGRGRGRAAEARVGRSRHPVHALPGLGGRGDRHLERRRPARDRQPRLRGRRSDGPGRALGLADHRRPALRRPALRLPGLRPAGALDRGGRARHRAGRDRRPGRARDREEALGLDADARPARRHPGRGRRRPRRRCARPAP